MGHQEWLRTFCSLNCRLSGRLWDMVICERFDLEHPWFYSLLSDWFEHDSFVSHSLIPDARISFIKEEDRRFISTNVEWRGIAQAVRSQMVNQLPVARIWQCNYRSVACCFISGPLQTTSLKDPVLEMNQILVHQKVKVSELERFVVRSTWPSGSIYASSASTDNMSHCRTIS